MKKLYIEVMEGNGSPLTSSQELEDLCKEKFDSTIMTPLFFEIMDVAIVRKINEINKKYPNKFYLLRKIDLSNFSISVYLSTARSSTDEIFSIEGLSVNTEYTDSDVL